MQGYEAIFVVLMRLKCKQALNIMEMQYCGYKNHSKLYFFLCCVISFFVAKINLI